MFAQKSKVVLAIGFSLLVVLMTAIAFIGLAKLAGINNFLEEASNEHHMKTKLTYTMRLAVRERMMSLILMVKLVDPFEIDKEQMHFSDLGSKFANARIKLLSYTLNDQERSFLTEQSELTKNVRPLHKKLMDLTIASDHLAANQFLMEKALPAHNQVIEKLKSLHDLQETIYHKSVESVTHTYYKAYLQFMAILGTLAIAFGISIILFVVRKISFIEDILATEKERYALAVRGANDGLWDWDLKNNKIYFSPRWKDLLGYDDHEIKNDLDEWFKRIHPEDAEKTMADLTAHLNGHTYYYENEHRMLHKDGQYRWILDRGLALRHEQNKPDRIAGSHTDISERKKFEEKLLQSELHIRGVLDNVHDSIITTDEHGVIESINDAAQRLFGYSSEEFIGLNITKLIAESFRTKYKKYMHDYFDNKTHTKEHFSYEIVGERKDKSTLSIELSFSEMTINKQRKFIVIMSRSSSSSDHISLSA